MLSATKQIDASVLLSVAVGQSRHALSMELSDLIKQRRHLMGLSQRALAKAMGVNPSAVAHWEGGATRPTHDKLQQLKLALGITDDIAPSGTQPLHAEIVEIGSEIALLALWRTLDDDERALFIRLLRRSQPVALKA